MVVGLFGIIGLLALKAAMLYGRNKCDWDFVTTQDQRLEAKNVSEMKKKQENVTAFQIAPVWANLLTCSKTIPT